MISLLRVLALVVCSAVSVVSFAAEVQSVNVNALPGDRTELVLNFDKAVAEPGSFKTMSPARVALDFDGAASALKQRRVKIGHAIAKRVNFVSDGEKLRVVVDLTRNAEFKTRVSGSQVYLLIGDNLEDIREETVPELTNADAEIAANTSAPESVTVTPADEAPSAVASELADVDFRRGGQGEGNVVLKLGDSDTAASVVQRGKKIVARLPKQTLPQRLKVRLDVTDFATPVKLVELVEKGEGSEAIITPEGPYEFTSYQSSGELIVSVKRPTKKSADELRVKKGPYSGERLSLNFQDIEVRTVLQLIADFKELNLVASDSVRGNITVRLKNVPWDQALDIVLRTRGLDKRQEGNVLLVAPAEELAARERQELEAQKEIRELAPLQTELFRLKYASAEEVCDGLFDCTGDDEGGDGGSDTSEGSVATGSILSERGSAVTDTRTNSVLMTDTAERLDNFRNLLEYIDIPVPQVLIESRIVKMNTNASRDLGIKWGGGFNLTNGGNPGSVTGGYDDIFTGAIDDSPFVDLPVLDPAGSFAFGYATSSSLIKLELSAKELEGDAELVSQPKVVTADKTKAVILQGKEIPYQSQGSLGTSNIEFKDALLRLEVTPQITPERSLILDVKITNDSVAGLVVSSLAPPAIDKEELETQVLVRDGETVVLGGIFQSEERNQIEKVPFFGDIPYLGHLFKSTSRSEERRELLIFITPKIINDGVLID